MLILGLAGLGCFIVGCLRIAFMVPSSLSNVVVLSTSGGGVRTGASAVGFSSNSTVTVDSNIPVLVRTAPQNPAAAVPVMAASVTVPLKLHLADPHGIPQRRTDNTGRALPFLMFLSHRNSYETWVDRHFADMYDAVSAEGPSPLRSYTVVRWGPGYSGWNVNLTDANNLALGARVEEHDVLFVWDMPHLRRLSGEGVGKAGKADIRATVVVRHHECRSNEVALRPCEPSVADSNVVLFAYAQEVQHLYRSMAHDRVLVHAPHCANPSPHLLPSQDPEGVIFRRVLETSAAATSASGGANDCISDFGHPDNDLNSGQGTITSSCGVVVLSKLWASRPVSALVVGHASPEVYPLRARMAMMVEAGMIPGAVHMAHPGWVAKDGTAVISNQAFYARQLRRAKVCLFDSSIYRYAVRKFVEAALAGCLVVSDMPSERQAEFIETIVVVDNKASAAEIATTVRWWVSHDEARARRVARARAVALEKYTCRKMVVDTLSQHVPAFSNGDFGIAMPHPFRESCIPLHYDRKVAARGLAPVQWLSRDDMCGSREHSAGVLLAAGNPQAVVGKPGASCREACSQALPSKASQAEIHRRRLARPSKYGLLCHARSIGIINNCKTLSTLLSCKLCTSRSMPYFPGFSKDEIPKKELLAGPSACYSHVFPDEENPWGEGFDCDSKLEGFQRLCPCKVGESPPRVKLHVEPVVFSNVLEHWSNVVH